MLKEIYKKQKELIKAIDDYCEREFGQEGDYLNLTKIPLAYSTLDIEDENGIIEGEECEVCFDMLSLTLHKYIAGEDVTQLKFDTIDEAIEYFKEVDFEDLIYWHM